MATGMFENSLKKSFCVSTARFRLSRFEKEIREHKFISALLEN